MIGSFWNLCRACPSMPVDKQLHSEYRSTYRWHEFTGSARPAVVRRAPAPNPNQFVGATNEPPLPRRKKCPELAYKSHEFIIGSEYTDARNAANRMPRSEERNGTPSRRSKSEGPPAVPNGRAHPISAEVDEPDTKQAGESSQGILKKTISKLSTEYRLQFVWPNVRRIKGPSDTQNRHQQQQQQQQPQTTTTTDQPKKSISMGAIRSQQQATTTAYFPQHHHHIHHYQQPQSHLTIAATMPTVHKKRTTNQKEATLHELEPLVSDADDRKPIEKQVTIVEKKVTARSFSQLLEQERADHFKTKKADYGFDDVTVLDNKQQQAQQLQEPIAPQDSQQEYKKMKKIVLNGSAPPHSKPDLDLWLKEVVELRKKAGEYKCRGWGIEIDPDLYKKQKDLWEQVSKNSSLSALSLASAMHRPITKEEKDQENNKKTTPVSIKSQKPRVPGQALFFDNKDEMHALPARFSYMRHHLERTTGPDVEEGALLPSPTREKLMPAIPKRDSISQRGSPKKTTASRHGSPQKGSPQKGSPKKVIKIRSQSVGPERESPKRQIRSASTAPTARYSIAGKKTATTTTGSTSTTPAERTTRPPVLSTTFNKRKPSSSLAPPPPSGGSRAQIIAKPNKAPPTNQSYTASAASGKPLQSQVQVARKSNKDNINLSCVRDGSGSVRGVKRQQPQPPELARQPLKKPQSPNVSKSNGSNVSTANGVHGEMMRKVAPPASLVVVAAGNTQNVDNKLTPLKHLAVAGRIKKKLTESDTEEGRETTISVSSCSPQPLVTEIAEEPLVKSPPEPTRVKSPEQIIMRSPDPVNWTVPLDTGKTFTVTQNVKEGETYSRPQSEIKASTPVEKPPPPPQSAPPELTEQFKMDAWSNAHTTTDTKSSLDGSSPTSDTNKNILINNLNNINNNDGKGNNTNNSNNKRFSKPLPGTTIRVLEDPLFDIDVVMASSAALHDAPDTIGTLSSSSNSTAMPTTARAMAADVLEKARDRFDRFWGGNVKEESV